MRFSSFLLQLVILLLSVFFSMRGLLAEVVISEKSFALTREGITITWSALFYFLMQLALVLLPMVFFWGRRRFRRPAAEPETPGHEIDRCPGQPTPEMRPHATPACYAAVRQPAPKESRPVTSRANRPPQAPAHGR